MMMSGIEKLKCQKTPIKDPITQPRPAKWRGLSLGRHRCTVCNSPFCVRVTRESAFRSLFELVWLFSQGREKLARNSNKWPFTTRDSAVRCYVFSRAPDGGASKIARGTPTRRRARAPRSVSALRVSARVSRVSPSRRRPRPCSRVRPRVQGFAAPLTSVFSGAPKCLSGAAPSRPRTRPLPS